MKSGKKSGKSKIQKLNIKNLNLETKKINEESELEREVETGEEETGKSEFREFLKPIGKTAPVLEKVATARGVELEEQLANIRINPREKEEEKAIKYNDMKSDYAGIANTERRGERVNYVESSGTYATMLQETKESKETRKRLGLGDSRTDQRTERWDVERQPFAEPDDSTKKYLSKGDYK